MRGPRRAIALAMLAALVSSSVAGWGVAFHLTEPDHHGGSHYSDDIAGLEVALHGHAHDSGTPPHGHPVLTTSSPARIPGKLILAIFAVPGIAAEPPAAGAGTRLPPSSGPTHDPPPRLASRLVLRI
ncbi:MAG: hypothetical protein ACHP85_02990 [Burkholderiales bacterium]